MPDGPEASPSPVRSRGWAYLAILLCTPVLYEVGQTVAAAPGAGAATGVAVLVALVAVVVAAAVALRTARHGRWSVLATAWFAAVLIGWLYLSVSEQVAGAGTSWLGAGLLPVSVVLVWSRRPAAADVWRAVDALAWTVVLGSLLVLVLEAVDVVPSWYRVLGGIVADLASFDRENHALLLGGLLGLDGRWGGFLRDPNLHGPVVAALTVYGFARAGAQRWVFAGAGAVFVLLTDSRTAFAAVACGLLLLLALPGWGVGFWKATWPKAGAVGIGLLFGLRLLSDLRTNTGGTLTMTGRTTMWPDFLSLAQESPWLGVGTRAIRDAVAAGQVPGWALTGHNQVVDTLVRYGWVGVVLVGLVLLLAVALGARGARRGLGIPLALLAVIVVAMVGNLLFDPRLLSPAWSWLVAAVLLAETAPRTLPA